MSAIEWMEGTCKNCASTFRVRGDQDIPSACGLMVCQAKINWTIEDWETKARFANIRLKLGIELNEIDRLALRKTERVSK